MNKFRIQPTIRYLDGLYRFNNIDLETKFLALPLGKHSKCYCIEVEELEVGVLVLDRLPDGNNLVIYELFILDQFRRQGIGSSILCEVEFIARREGFLRIALCSIPLDNDISKNDLLKFYENHGYKQVRNVPNDLYKTL